MTNVAEAEKIAKNYDLVPLLQEKFSNESVKDFTEVLKGFRPREDYKERSRDEWYSIFQEKTPKLTEFNVIISDLIEDVVNRKRLTRETATRGVIGAFRLLQAEIGMNKNYNGYKHDAVRSLLHFEIKKFELRK